MLKANYSPATSDFDRELKDRVSKYLDNLGTDHYRTRSQFILFYLLFSLIGIYSSFFYFDYASEYSEPRHPCICTDSDSMRSTD